MARPITVPRTVTLPTAPQIGAGESYRRIGISRAVAHVWRRHGFPPSDRSHLIDTATLAAWLAARGTSIHWI